MHLVRGVDEMGRCWMRFEIRVVGLMDKSYEGRIYGSVHGLTFLMESGSAGAAGGKAYPKLLCVWMSNEAKTSNI